MLNPWPSLVRQVQLGVEQRWFGGKAKNKKLSEEALQKIKQVKGPKKEIEAPTIAKKVAKKAAKEKQDEKKEEVKVSKTSAQKEGAERQPTKDTRVFSTAKTVEPRIYLSFDSKGRARNDALQNASIPGTTIIRNKKEAKRVLRILRQLKDRFHAWDTETYDLEIKKEGPVGKGKILCATAFCGPDIDFGNGPRLFVDNYEDAEGVLNVFTDYFRSGVHLKVFHNYGFDRHVLFNHGIDVKGFGGDTMHMARLLNPSLLPGDYSLARLSEIYAEDIQTTKLKILKYLKTSKKTELDAKEYKALVKRLHFFQERFIKRDTKTNMKTVFGRWREKKDGSLGQIWEIPGTQELHTNPFYTENWVEYAGFDAEITYFLRQTLAAKLCALEVKIERMKNLLDVYSRYWKPFGELLTDMEREGIKVNVVHLRDAQALAEKELHTKENQFLQWVHSLQPDAKEFNANSTQQLQHLLFAPFTKKNGEKVEKTRTFTVENKTTDSGKKFREMSVSGLGIKPVDLTTTGTPQADQNVIRKLAGKNPEKGEYGLAYDHFKALDNEAEGKKCSQALHSWLEFKSIETLLSTYILPLQNAVDQNGRIHCSLNINTETGRLSARRPNLQNQPAHDKDKFRIRHAFEAEEGKSLIVADYGQLELRILAHMTKCHSMIEAFKLGGDFHSRTAISMHPEIKEEVEKGEVLLEWDFSKGPAPKPLIKEKFSAQRKTAKGLNFSIAYGKTAAGFAKDWNCSIKEAQEVIERWYAERLEVKEWQNNVKKIALEKGWTQTLIGRYRDLTKHFVTTTTAKSHGLRAAINTPIQGGAADVVIGAMVKIWKDAVLKKLGWKLILQVHDEVILEGPSETAEEALQQVKKCMANPLYHKLLIDLEVDAKIGRTWYESK